MKAIVKMFAFFATMAGVLSCNQIERSELQMNQMICSFQLNLLARKIQS